MAGVCGVRGTADWFGVSKDGDATQKWQRKSLRHCSMRYGRLKPQVIREMDLSSQDNISLTSTETPPPLYVPSSAHAFGMQKVWYLCHLYIWVIIPILLLYLSEGFIVDLDNIFLDVSIFIFHLLWYPQYFFQLESRLIIRT